MGFTHIGGRSREKGYFTMYRKTIGKLMAAKLKDIRQKLRQLRRRSQRSRWTWTRFQQRLGALLPLVEILHPWPNERFAAKHPR